MWLEDFKCNVTLSTPNWASCFFLAILNRSFGDFPLSNFIYFWPMHTVIFTNCCEIKFDLIRITLLQRQFGMRAQIFQPINKWLSVYFLSETNILVGYVFHKMVNLLNRSFWNHESLVLERKILYHMCSSNEDCVTKWLQGMAENDFEGLTFENYLKDWPRITGEDVLTNVLQVTVSRSKWWNLAILFLMVIFYRILFFATVKFAEYLQPWIHGVILPLLRPPKQPATHGIMLETIAPVAVSPLHMPTPERPLIK